MQVLKTLNLLLSASVKIVSVVSNVLDSVEPDTENYLSFKDFESVGISYWKRYGYKGFIYFGLCAARF